MSNWCSNELYFWSADASETKRLYDDVSNLMNGRNAVALSEITSFYGDDDEIGGRGTCYSVNFEKNAVYMYCETAWGPSDDLFDFIAEHYKKMKYVYMAIEPGCDVYVNTDRPNKPRFFPQKYILDEENEGMMFFSNAKELLAKLNELQETHIRTLKAAKKYASDWNCSHDEYLAIHVFNE